MTERLSIVSHISVYVDGIELEPAVLNKVINVEVDQHLHLPGTFAMRVYDPGTRLLDSGMFDLARRVSIFAKTNTGKRIALIKGEITALEPQFDDGMVAHLEIRGYDLTHRLYRVCRSKTYLNVKDSDLARQFADRAGFAMDIDNTTIVYEHLYQDNQSDLRFLQQRARRIGFVCYLAEQTLHFHHPRAGTPTATVAWGGDLQSFRPRLSIAEQRQETQVRGWDMHRKAPVLGRSNTGTLYPVHPHGQNGAEWDSAFGPSAEIIVGLTVTGQHEAELIATARQDELSGVLVEAEGSAFRRPDLQVGTVVKIEGVGKRLSGDYLITRAVHVHQASGLATRFMVCGTRRGLLTDLLDRRHDHARWPGVMPAVVTNTDDPARCGRVKIKLPWLSEDEESAWARVVIPGAGADSGLANLPAVDDEVMVAFQHGDVNCPVVLGGLWNGRDRMPQPVFDAGPGDTPLIHSWYSRTGHHVTIYDNADNGIEIATNRGQRIRLDADTNRLHIQSEGEVRISGARVLIEATEGNLDLRAARTATTTATEINLQQP